MLFCVWLTSSSGFYCCFQNNQSINLIINIKRKKGIFSHFLVADVCVGLWLLQTVLAAEVDDHVNITVHIHNGTESANLSCGEVPEHTTGIEWLMNKFNGWQRILKYYHNKPDRAPEHYPKYSRDKYDISKSVKTYFVVKNIDFTDTGLYKCRTRGGSLVYSYTTLLQVVGKSTTWIFFSTKVHPYERGYFR